MPNNVPLKLSLNCHDQRLSSTSLRACMVEGFREHFLKLQQNSGRLPRLSGKGAGLNNGHIFQALYLLMERMGDFASVSNGVELGHDGLGDIGTGPKRFA